MAGLRRAVGVPLLVLGVLLPLLPLLEWSVAGSWRFPALLPHPVTGRGWRLVTDPHSEVLRGLRTSVTIAGTVALLAAPLGLSAGRALGLYAFRGRRAAQFLLLLPALVPGLAVTLGIQVFFIRYGLADTSRGVVLVDLVPTVPYVSLVLAGAYATYDIAAEEQARTLGAGRWQVLWHVTLPAVRPALVVASLFAFLIAWSEYILTFLIGGGVVKTLPVLLFAYLGGSDTTEAAAASLVFLLPPLLLTVAASRYLSGRTGAAVGLGRL